MDKNQIPFYGADGRSLGFRTLDTAERLVASGFEASYGRKKVLRAIWLNEEDGGNPVETHAPTGTRYSFIQILERGRCYALRRWSRRIAPEFHSRVQFPLAVALARGSTALEQIPRVIVGTIHSVKGGQADVVFLFPDLSAAGDAAYRSHGLRRDSVVRQFYVGTTRARHTLYICQKECSMAVEI